MEDYLILTKYIYPIDKYNIKPFFNGIYFDNPRTKEEIDYVANLLQKINQEEIRFPEEQEQIGEGYLTLRKIAQEFFINNSNQEIVKSFFKKNGNEKNIYKLLAKMWVIVKCDSISDEDELKGFFSIKINPDSFMDNSNLTYEKKNDSLNNYNIYNGDLIFQYLNFLSFLLGDNDSIYFSILIDNKYGIIKKNIGFNLFSLLITISFNKESNIKDLPYCTFNHVYDEILKIVGLTKDRYNSYKFRHLCKIIDKMSDTQDDSLILLSLVSIIEMLITHNPENSRFNVEESISRQFINKTTFLLYENDNFIDVKKVREELKLAYRVRSDITHGNFEDMTKTLKKLHKFYGLNENGEGIEYSSIDSSINYLNYNMSKYVKVVLYSYLTSETKLEILKEV